MASRKGKNYQAIISSPIGPLGIVVDDGSLTQVDFLPKGTRLLAPESNTATRVVKQLQQYFSKSRQGFRLPLKLCGTQYQLRVWQALQNIPLGKTITYGELAKILQSSPRAVGGACRANPVPIIVPCHRVVARTGIGGFAGQTRGDRVHTKIRLLELEGAVQPLEKPANKSHM